MKKVISLYASILVVVVLLFGTPALAQVTAEDLVDTTWSGNVEFVVKGTSTGNNAQPVFASPTNARVTITQAEQATQQNAQDVILFEGEAEFEIGDETGLPTGTEGTYTFPITGILQTEAGENQNQGGEVLMNSLGLLEYSGTLVNGNQMRLKIHNTSLSGYLPAAGGPSEEPAPPDDDSDDDGSIPTAGGPEDPTVTEDDSEDEVVPSAGFMNEVGFVAYAVLTQESS